MGFAQRCVAVLLALSFGVTVAVAGGFQVNEHGAKGMGMSGAFVAQANDGSAIFYNPAGLGFQKGLRILLGGTMISPRTSYTSTAGTLTDMVAQNFLIPNGYVTYGLDNGLSFGVGVFVPYGLGTEWPWDWQGQRLAVKTDLNTMYISPAIAYKFHETFSVGVGFSYIFGNVKLSRRVGVSGMPVIGMPLPASGYDPTDGSVELDGDGSGFDFSAGFLWKPSPEFSMGASYRHSAEIDYEGDAVFVAPPVEQLVPPVRPLFPTGLQPYFPGGTGKTTITNPNNLWIGAAITPIPALTVELDAQWVFWKVYDTLKIDIPVGPTAPAPISRPLQGPSVSPKDWGDALIMRLGAEYRFTAISLRAGVIYDLGPQPDKSVEPLLPDTDRFEATVGIGWQFAKHWHVDAAYQLILGMDRTVTAPTNSFPGTYETTANLFGLSIGYSM